MCTPSCSLTPSSKPHLLAGCYQGGLEDTGGRRHGIDTAWGPVSPHGREWLDLHQTEILHMKNHCPQSYTQWEVQAGLEPQAAWPQSLCSGHSVKPLSFRSWHVSGIQEHNQMHQSCSQISVGARGPLWGQETLQRWENMYNVVYMTGGDQRGRKKIGEGLWRTLNTLLEVCTFIWRQRGHPEGF